MVKYKGMLNGKDVKLNNIYIIGRFFWKVVSIL